MYICLAPLNRMVLSFDPDLKQEADPVDHFMIEHEQSTDMIKKYSDQAIAGNTVQLLSKLQWKIINKDPTLNCH